MLLKYTAGDGNELIKQCALIEPLIAGYTRAKRLLQRDYGHPPLSQRHAEKAESWP